MKLADRLKPLGANALDRSGALWVALQARPRQSVVIVNYHATPDFLRPSLAAQFDWYRDTFECLGEDELLAFLDGSLRLKRPGLAITFDDGFASNASVAAPLLAERGLRGWFFLPGGFLDEPLETQGGFVQRAIRDAPNVEHPDLSRLRAMTWSEARGLVAAGHVVGCHTWTHTALGPAPSEQVVQREVVESRALLEARLQSPVRSFCWVRGRLQDYSAAADAAVRKHYALAFMTFSKVVRPGDDPFSLHRFNVEASNSLAMTRFQVSAFNQRLFAARRQELASILASTST